MYLYWEIDVKRFAISFQSEKKAVPSTPAVLQYAKNTAAYPSYPLNDTAINQNVLYRNHEKTSLLQVAALITGPEKSRKHGEAR